MNSPLISQEVPGTAIKYEGEFKCGVNYFWRVRVTEPFPSDWSATFSFFSQPKSAPIVMPGATTTVISPTTQTVIVILPPGIPDLSIYLMIGIFVILVICMFFFTLASRKAPLNQILKDRKYLFPRTDGVKNIFLKIKDWFRSIRYQRKSVTSTKSIKEQESSLIFRIKVFLGKFKDNVILVWRRWRYLSSRKDKPPDKSFHWKQK
jgi:hypothetical protein